MSGWTVFDNAARDRHRRLSLHELNRHSVGEKKWLGLQMTMADSEGEDGSRREVQMTCATRTYFELSPNAKAGTYFEPLIQMRRIK